MSVIDLSSGGTQIETVGYRIRPGATVVLEILVGGGTISVPATVVRCQVSGVAPQVFYRGGLAFKRAIAIPRMGARKPEALHEHAHPLHAHARFSLALRRRAEAAARPPAGGLVAPPRSGVVDGWAPAAALAIMDTPAARRNSRMLERELAGLFEKAAIALEDGLEPDDICEQLVHHLRRSVPAIMIRLVAAEHAQRLLTADPFYFDVRSARGEADTRLLIDLSPSSPLGEWHFMYLKVAAQVLSAISQLKRCATDETRVIAGPADPPRVTADAADAPRVTADAAEGPRVTADAADGPRIIADAADAPREVAHATPALRQGWHKVVVRYTDGRTLKGYSREFTTSSGALDVLAHPDAPEDTTISVRLAHLKAVFFVRDFDGAPDRIDGDRAVEHRHGRRIVVTFLDGETLSGTTLNYNTETAGFFIRPDDAGSNNTRVFIARRSVRQMRWA